MIPRLKADLRAQDLLALWPESGGADTIPRFEQAFADLAGQKYAVAFPYGRTAQIALLKALNRPGAEVICPSYTCVVVPHAIVKSGMEPVFVDSSDTDYNMDWRLVEKATGSRTAAVIATSIFGHPVNGPAFHAYREKFPDTPILQDCAHSFFANDTHHEGLAAFYGLNVSKIITSVFGGMVTTDDGDLARILRKIRAETSNNGGVLKEVKRSLYLAAVLVAFTRPVYGFVNRLESLGFLDRFVKYYDPSIIDLPDDAFVAMGKLQARIGIRQCDRYDEIVSHRRILASIYHDLLQGCADFIMPPVHENATVSHFVIQTRQAEKIKEACRAYGYQLGELIDYDCSEMPTYKDARYLGEKKSSNFPSLVINLPVHMGVRELDARRICKVVKAAV